MGIFNQDLFRDNMFLKMCVHLQDFKLDARDNGLGRNVVPNQGPMCYGSIVLRRIHFPTNTGAWRCDGRCPPLQQAHYACDSARAWAST